MKRFLQVSMFAFACCVSVASGLMSIVSLGVMLENMFPDTGDINVHNVTCYIFYLFIAITVFSISSGIVVALKDEVDLDISSSSSYDEFM